MATSSSSTPNAGPAGSSRSTVQDEPKAPVDERLLKELQAHRPYEAMDDMILAVIDQTYAALIEFLPLGAAPPEGGRTVKARQVVHPPAQYSTVPPMLLVVEASAMHCCVHVTEIDDAAAAEKCPRSVSLRKRGARSNRRTRAKSSPGWFTWREPPPATTTGGGSAPAMYGQMSPGRRDWSRDALLRRLIDGAPDHHERESLNSPSSASEPPAIRRRQPLVNRRVTVNASPGMIHLARIDTTGGDNNNEGKGGGDRWKKAVGEVRPDVSEKGLVGVLDAMRSHLDTAIRLEDGVIAMASAGGCRSRIRATDIVRVRMLLGQVRRELDLDAVMRRLSSYRWATLMTKRRRPAAEMDVDKVDAEDVLMKRLKGLHVMGNTSGSETNHGEQGNDDALQSIESIVTAKLSLD
ncbi:unnamed protein product [Urochloa decumbens]|uniref:Uncharacterized protein n=1 Tax=Urochloa decumbens TaxID=240449 RepID=A0ABC9G4D1_9POAL